MDDELYKRLQYSMTPATMYAFWDAVAEKLEDHVMNVQARVAAIAIRAGLETLPLKEK